MQDSGPELAPFMVDFEGRDAGRALYRMTEDATWAAVWERPDGYCQCIHADTLEQAAARLTQAIAAHYEGLS